MQNKIYIKQFPHQSHNKKKNTWTTKSKLRKQFSIRTVGCSKTSKQTFHFFWTALYRYYFVLVLFTFFLIVHPKCPLFLIHGFLTFSLHLDGVLFASTTIYLSKSLWIDVFVIPMLQQITGITSVHIQNYIPKNIFLEVNCWGTGKCIGNLSVCLAKFCSMGLISVF